MPDINLLQNQLSADSDLRYRNLLSRIELVLVLLFVLSLVSGSGLFTWKNVSSRAQARNLKTVEEKKVELESATQEKRDKVVKFQAQTVNLSLLLEEHKYWTNVLKLINSAAISGVQFLDMTTTKEGNVVINGIAPELPTIAAFTKNLNELPYVSQVVLNSSSLSDVPNSVFYRFTITITFDLEVLKFQEENVEEQNK